METGFLECCKEGLDVKDKGREKSHERARKESDTSLIEVAVG
jgi:hypothetical protein